MFSKTFDAKVLAVTERKEVIRTSVIDRGLPTQELRSETESLGWYAYLEGNISIYLGAEKPKLEAGDELLITLEKRHE